MKHTLLAVLCLFSACTLAACGSSAEESIQNSASEIRPAVFSGEAAELLELLDDELAFLDYTLDSSIQSMSVDLWVYQAEGWENAGRTYGAVTPGEHRLGVRMTGTAADLFDVTETGHVKSSYPAVVPDFTGCGAILGSRLSESTEISAGREIPLWVRLGQTETAAPSGTALDFRQADCAAGIAVTATFYSTPAD